MNKKRNCGRKLWESLADIFFPKFCFGCGKEGVWLCGDCKSTLDILEYHYCLCAQNPLRFNRPGKCKKCAHKKLSGLYFAVSYKENSLVKNLILKFKYEPFVKTLSKTLADLIIEHIYLSGKDPIKIFRDSILVPIPLVKKRLKYRGFNQAEEIAKELSQNTNTPLISDNLIKFKNTPSQTNLSKEQRWLNIKNTFLCKNPFEFKNKRVFLVDDVYTTGATMEEAASTLKKAGAKEVWGIVVAREG